VTTQMFGQRVKRNEDPRLLTGKGRYVDDFEHGAAEVAFVRSELAHARIVDIDVSGALDIDGVLGVYTHEDLEGDFAEPLPVLVRSRRICSIIAFVWPYGLTGADGMVSLNCTLLAWP